MAKIYLSHENNFRNGMSENEDLKITDIGTKRAWDIYVVENTKTGDKKLFLETAVFYNNQEINDNGIIIRLCNDGYWELTDFFASVDSIPPSTSKSLETISEKADKRYGVKVLSREELETFPDVLEYINQVCK